MNSATTQIMYAASSSQFNHVGAGLVPALKAWDLGFVMRVSYGVMRKTIFSRPGGSYHRKIFEKVPYR